MGEPRKKAADGSTSLAPGREERRVEIIERRLTGVAQYCHQGFHHQDRKKTKL